MAIGNQYYLSAELTLIPLTPDVALMLSQTMNRILIQILLRRRLCRLQGETGRIFRKKQNSRICIDPHSVARAEWHPALKSAGA